MRKIVAGLFVSLDGVAESPEKWHFPYFNEEMGQIVGAQMEAADCMLLGRVTYQGFADYWPDSQDEIADHMNGIRKVVVSTTLESADWKNSTLVRGELAKSMTRLKQEPGKEISVVGSLNLVQSLLRENLLDELRLLIHPIVLGSGKRVFADGDRVPLKLISSRTLSTGVVYAVYEPAGR
jgi:dihydrofolate reductase